MWPKGGKTAQLARNMGEGGKSLRSSVAQTTTNQEKSNSHHIGNHTKRRQGRQRITFLKAISRKNPDNNFYQQVKQYIPKMTKTQTVQTDNFEVLVGTQTDVSEMQDPFVSRINYNIASQEDRAPNEESPIMARTQPKATQLEACHHETTEGIVATVNQTTMTETEEDTSPFRKRLKKVLGVKIIAAATKKDRNLRLLINFVKKRD